MNRRTVVIQVDIGTPRAKPTRRQPKACHLILILLVVISLESGSSTFKRQYSRNVLDCHLPRVYDRTDEECRDSSRRVGMTATPGVQYFAHVSKPSGEANRFEPVRLGDQGKHVLARRSGVCSSTAEPLKHARGLSKMLGVMSRMMLEYMCKTSLRMGSRYVQGQYNEQSD